MDARCRLPRMNPRRMGAHETHTSVNIVPFVEWSHPHPPWKRAGARKGLWSLVSALVPSFTTQLVEYHAEYQLSTSYGGYDKRRWDNEGRNMVLL
ncbi:hypothetical protein MKX08_004218 [Trichoderma sp. CBMAI-0020]|nr:hypothetical protein MKX08_004218 [Trichoderma sp. CBMAI-0020]